MATSTFSSLIAFKSFEQERPEKGSFFENAKQGTLYNIRPKDFLDLDWILISFGDYQDDELALKFSPGTNEFFLGSMNDGGHAPRFRVLKIDRDQVYHDGSTLLAWTANHSYKMWLGVASDLTRNLGS